MKPEDKKPEKIIKSGVELSEELHKKVRVARAQRGVKMKDAVRSAFTLWLAEGSTSSLPSDSSSGFGNLPAGQREKLTAYAETLRADGGADLIPCPEKLQEPARLLVKLLSVDVSAIKDVEARAQIQDAQQVLRRMIKMAQRMMVDYL